VLTSCNKELTPFQIPVLTYLFIVGMHRIPYFRIRPDPDPTGCWKNTGYPAGSGSRSGAPL